VLPLLLVLDGDILSGGLEVSYWGYWPWTERWEANLLEGRPDTIRDLLGSSGILLMSSLAKDRVDTLICRSVSVLAILAPEGQRGL